VPELISNYKIIVGDQRSADLMFNHFLQRERLPEGAVLVLAEVADWLSNLRSDEGKKRKDDPESDRIRAENKTISKFLSKIRHYLDGYLLCDEQAAAEIFIALRRVGGFYRRTLEIDKYVCEPRFYAWLLNWHKRWIFKKNNCGAIRCRKYLDLTKKINRIGFFAVQYELRENIELSAAVKETGAYFITRNLPFKYASRNFEFEYMALNQALNLTSETSLYVHPGEV